MVHGKLWRHILRSGFSRLDVLNIVSFHCNPVFGSSKDSKGHIVATLLLSTVIPMNPNHNCKRLCLVAAVEATGEAAVQQPQYVMDGYGLTQSRERERTWSRFHQHFRTAFAHKDPKLDCLFPLMVLLANILVKSAHGEVKRKMLNENFKGTNFYLKKNLCLNKKKVSWFVLEKIGWNQWLHKNTFLTVPNQS